MYPAGQSRQTCGVGEDQGPPGESQPTSAANPRDGLIDFSHYSLAQLEELQFGIDRRSAPRDHANLMAELERRRKEARPATAGEAWISGRFTVRDGWWGWLQSKYRRSPLYSEGAIAVRTDDVVLRGRQRTWLGVPVDAELSFAASAVRNAARDGALVCFDCRRFGPWWHRIEFRAETVAAAESLVSALPRSRTSGFGRRWEQLRELNQRMAAIGGFPWVTCTIVGLNVAVFAAMAIATRRLGEFDPVQMLDWGANYGPLTISGPWWRLITALFLHGSLLHLLLNMWAFWNVGRLTERLYGNWCFAFLYFASGLLSSLASIAWDPTHSTVGASGPIFGIFGAFLACLAHPRHYVPASIVRVYWLSTLAFVAFNLVNGFQHSGIDNAAHVGGLVSGFVLGLVLMRPLQPEVRAHFALPQSTAALALTALGVLAALWQVRGIGSQLGPPEQYLRAHSWYLNGEASNLREWQDLAVRAGAGSISDAELAARFDQQIVPFWKSASERLQREQSTLPPAQRDFGALVVEFVKVRLDWARALAEAGRSENAQSMNEVLRLAQETDSAQARIERLELRATMDHRPRALSNRAWVRTLRDLWPGHAWRCVREPENFGPQPLPSDSPTDGPAMRLAAGCRAQSLFVNAYYRALDRWLESSAGTLGDLPDGGSTLQGIAGGLSDLFDYGTMTPEEVLGRMADWRRAVPGTVQAELMEAMYFQSWAWSVRGKGYASSVSRQAWAVFAHRTAMAAAGLAEVAPHAVNQPLRYTLGMSVGVDQSLDREQLRHVFEEGIKRTPAYQPLYRQMLRILQPRWGGSFTEVNTFIRERSTRPNGLLNFATYAELYWIFATLEGDETNIFADGEATWLATRQGFQELTRLYPRSDFVLNAFARFACVARDAEEYRRLRPVIDKRRSAMAWTSKTTIDACDAQFSAKH